MGSLTCQLTRVERLSMMSLCSVRVGGPYLRDVAKRGGRERGRRKHRVFQQVPPGAAGTISTIDHILSDLIHL